MKSSNDSGFTIGTRHFHDEPNINYQFNRVMSLCNADAEVLMAAAKRIKTLEDWVGEFSILSERAKEDSDMPAYAAYTRAMNFYLEPSDPRKMRTYLDYTRTIKEINQSDFSDKLIQTLEVPYENGALPVWHIKAVNQNSRTPKAVFHLGYDSLKEELISVIKLFSAKGIEVWMFEGPGQGEPLYIHGIPMTHEWEKPVKAVLDYLNLDDVTLIGLSLGGYLAPRAAIHEPRIKRVIAWGVLYDFFDVVSTRRGKALAVFLNTCMKLRLRKIMNAIVNIKMKKDTYTRWGVGHGMTVFKAKDPWEYFNALKRYSLKGLSHKIKQDFLLLAGTKDHFIPEADFTTQIAALTSVKSLTARLFTECENAENHVQFGNLPLAVDVMSNWIHERSEK